MRFSFVEKTGKKIVFNDPACGQIACHTALDIVHSAVP